MGAYDGFKWMEQRRIKGQQVLKLRI